MLAIQFLLQAWWLVVVATVSGTATRTFPAQIHLNASVVDVITVSPIVLCEPEHTPPGLKKMGLNKETITSHLVSSPKEANSAHEAIARFFYANNIAFNVASGKTFQRM